MVAPMLDALKLARRLSAAGMPPEQAAGVAEAIAEGFREVATKAGTASDGVQLSFLPGAEVELWRSLRSVSRSDPRTASSER